MSTKVKNTLFRFVTMRTPELVEQEKINDFFVKHPESALSSYVESTSLFLNPISNLDLNQSRKNVLATSAVSFAENSIKKKEVLLENSLVNKRLYDFAIWLTKNRTTFSFENFEEKVAYSELEEPGFPQYKWDKISDENLIILWDNLFYQIIVGKSAYIRDLILSILVAHFFLKNRFNHGGDFQALRKLAQAKIIIPKILFEKEIVANKGEALKQALANLPLQTKELDKELAVILAKEKLSTIQEQIAVFQKAKNQYDKTTQKAYDLAQKNYNDSVAELMAHAEVVEKTFVDPITGRETIVKEYVDLVVPSFEFTKPEELNTTLLSSKLNTATNTVLTTLIQEEEVETFDEVLQTLNKQVESISSFIFENTNSTQKTVVTDGMLLPVVQDYATKTFAVAGLGMNSNQPLQMLFSDSEGNADVVQANYKIVFDDETEITGTSFTDSIVNNKLKVKIFPEGINLFDKTSFTLTGSFTKSTGEKINFTGICYVGAYNYGISDDIIFNRIADGTTTYTVKGNGTYTLELIDLGEGDDNSNNGETGDTGSTGAVVKPYIPSGFGIKRLGIADYRKVEQEICCYVPGEVSHIENVMAREYKEKSTRRLRRTEDTTTTSKEQEIEKLTDTTSTDRFEMNQEVASVLSEQTSMGVHASFGANWGGGPAGSYNLNTGADFANNTSTEESNNQAVTHAKEVTERALDRVVQKVKEERISKIIEEFEENSKHGFDNRKGDKHVSGVYRWVDKIYKNKVLNYGKRLMYEFMLPQPAHFHYLNTSGKENVLNGDIIEKPIDPRSNLSLGSTFENTYKFWAEKYGADIVPQPEKSITIGKNLDFSNNSTRQAGSKSDSIQIPEGYKAISGKLSAVLVASGDLAWTPAVQLTIGNYSNWLWEYNGIKQSFDFTLNNFTDNIPIGLSYANMHAVLAGFNITCVQTDGAIEKWQLETFNAIIEAYEEKLAEYNAKIAELKALQGEKVRTNPLFYREIENTVLRKNCIEYLASHDALGVKNLLMNPNAVKDFRVAYDNPELETYAAKVKFFEQAFEWNLMSYYFYPFYWAEKDKWEALYNINDIDDPTFRAFLRSGMARVIITVRPGFEEAVNWYMSTGQIWNGGQVPTMDDELFVSIIEELRNLEGEVEETWESRVPTSLTVIQAGSIGLNAQGLPCNVECNDNLLFDSDGNPVLDANGNAIKVIDQTDTVLGGDTESSGDGETGGGGPGQGPIEDPQV